MSSYTRLVAAGQDRIKENMDALCKIVDYPESTEALWLLFDVYHREGLHIAGTREIVENIDAIIEAGYEIVEDKIIADKFIDPMMRALVGSQFLSIKLLAFAFMICEWVLTAPTDDEGAELITTTWKTIALAELQLGMALGLGFRNKLKQSDIEAIKEEHLKEYLSKRGTNAANELNRENRQNKAEALAWWDLNRERLSNNRETGADELLRIVPMKRTTLRKWLINT